MKSSKQSEGPAREDVDEVFALWCEVTHRTAATKLDRKRRSRIEWALSEYPKEDVLDAIRGLGASEWHMSPERNDSARQLTLVLRDAEKVEGFRDRWRAPRSVHAAATSRPAGPKGYSADDLVAQAIDERRRRGEG